MGWKDKTVLITGIGGFIGHKLGRFFLEKGAQVIGIDNFSYVEKKFSQDLLNKIKLIEGDVSDKKTFEKVEENVDVIFHFAAPSSIVLFNKFPEKCYLETVVGCKNVFEFAKERGVEKIVYPSSGSVYGGNPPPHKETIYPKPLNLYGAAKIACESVASSYEPFVKSVGLRIFAGYGPGEERKKDFASVVYLFLNDIMKGKAPIIYGDGNQSRDFIYIDDVVKAIVRAAEIDYTGIINVGTGVSTSFLQLVEIICEIVGKKIQPIFIEKPMNYVNSLSADTTLMRKLLKIEPITLEEGVKKFYEYLKGRNS